jgi:hypothetical protein
LHSRSEIDQLKNAASTFAELVDKGVPMQDAYVGAGITVPFSVVAGALTGGGAEVAAVRALTGTGAAKAGAKQLLKAPLKEGGQEMGEELGQIAGEGAATGEMPSAVGAGKQLAVAGTLGAAMGAGVDVATQAGQRTRAKAAPPDTEPHAEAPAAPRAVEPVPLPAGTPAAAMDQNTPLDSAQDAPAAAQPDIVASSTEPNPGQQADRGALAQRMEAQAELAAAGDVPASEAALPAAAGELDDVTGTPFQQRGDLVPDRAARTAAIEAQEAVERQAQSPERIAAEQTMPGKPGDADLAANERHDAAQIRRGATASKVEQAQAAPAVAAAAPAGTAPGSVTVQAKTFPQYQLERGFKPSGMRKGTPEWDTLLAEWAAITNARAGTNPEGSGSAGVPARESQNRGPSHPANLGQNPANPTPCKAAVNPFARNLLAAALAEQACPCSNTAQIAQAWRRMRRVDAARGKRPAIPHAGIRGTPPNCMSARPLATPPHNCRVRRAWLRGSQPTGKGKAMGRSCFTASAITRRPGVVYR